MPGLHLLGPLRWMHTFKSGLLSGVAATLDIFNPSLCPRRRSGVRVGGFTVAVRVAGMIGVWDNRRRVPASHLYPFRCHPQPIGRTPSVT